MKRQYHLPGVADGADTVSDSMSRQAGRQLAATVLAGVARGVRKAAPAGLHMVPDGGGGPVGVPLHAAGSPPTGPAAVGGPPAAAPPRSGRARRDPARGQARPAVPAGREAKRKPPDAAPPAARVFTFPGQARWRLLFPTSVTRQQVENWVFLGGGLPDGFSLTAGLPGGGLPSPVWHLSWADFRSRHQMDSVEFTRTFLTFLTPYGQGLANRALLGGDATDEEVAAWTAEQKEKARRWEEYDRQFVPALGMTRGEASARLARGPYEVNGQFVWIGFERALGRTIVETYPLSSNEVFNRDMRFYLSRGLSVSEAVAAFNSQWDEILAIELAFAGTGAGYRVPDVGEVAELENEAGLLGRRSARAQGFLSEGDIALNRALSSSDSVAIRTELAGQAEIGAVRRAETGAQTAPVSGAVAPGRRIGFAPPSAADRAPTAAAPTPSAEYRPVAGFGRDRQAMSAQPSGAVPPQQQTYTQMPPARQVSSASGEPGPAPGAAMGRRRGQPATAMSGERPGGRDTPSVTPGKPAGGPAAQGKAETAVTDLEPSRKLTVWEKNGKITGDVPGLQRRLRSRDARTLDEARAEFDDLQEQISQGEKPHIEHFSEAAARRAADEVRSENISTATKSELENSGWLRRRLPRPEDRRELMDWLKSGHREGELGKEPEPGKFVPKGHDHYKPGARDTEEMVKEWERTKGRRRN